MKRISSSAALLCASLLSSGALAAPEAQGLLAARAGFVTKAAPSNYEADGAPEKPPPGPFELVRYRSPAGMLAAYVSRDPGDGKKRPAVLWAHGGFGGISAGDLEQVEPLTEAGIVVMCPSWRGENDNRGRYEMFYGEVEDALAALDHLLRLPHVDPARVYVAGHSTGGTMALLLAESTDRVRAVYSLGGAPDIERVVADGGYGQATPPFPATRAREAELRSPIRFVSEIKRPTFYFEGARSPSYVADARKMADLARERSAPFTAQMIEGGNHFNIVTPLLRLIARKITADTPAITAEEAQASFAASRPSYSMKHAPVDFVMELRTGGAAVCQVLPAGAENAEDCDGFNPAAAREAMAGSSPQPVTMAVVGFDAWIPVVAATYISGRFRVNDAESRGGFMKGVKSTMPPGSGVHGDAPGTDYDMVTVDGRPALKLIVDMAAAEGSPEAEHNHTISYVVPTEGGVMMVQFSGSPAHAAELARFAATSVATLRIRPPGVDPVAPSDKAYRLGLAVGAMMVPLFLIVVGAVVGIVVFRSRDGKKAERK